METLKPNVNWKNILMSHMNQYKTDTWIDHSKWAKKTLGIDIDPVECCKLMTQAACERASKNV